MQIVIKWVFLFRFHRLLRKKAIWWSKSGNFTSDGDADIFDSKAINCITPKMQTRYVFWINFVRSRTQLYHQSFSVIKKCQTMMYSTSFNAKYKAISVPRILHNDSLCMFMNFQRIEIPLSGTFNNYSVSGKNQQIHRWCRLLLLSIILIYALHRLPQNISLSHFQVFSFIFHAMFAVRKAFDKSTIHQKINCFIGNILQRTASFHELLLLSTKEENCKNTVKLVRQRHRRRWKTFHWKRHQELHARLKIEHTIYYVHWFSRWQQ